MTVSRQRRGMGESDNAARDLTPTLFPITRQRRLELTRQLQAFFCFFAGRASNGFD